MAAGIVLEVFAAALGLVMGSFANVVIWRLPKGENLSSPPSHCPACGTPVRWFDNVPVVSWVVLRARCRDCGSLIPWRYPFVEALCGLLFWLAARLYGHPAPASAAAGLFWFLVVLSFIDLDTMRLPNRLVAALAGLGAFAAILAQLSGIAVVPLVGVSSGPLSEPAVGAAAGAAAGAGASLLIAAAYAAVRRVEGFGMGDVKLLGAMGLFLGPYVLFAFIAAATIGSAWAVTLMLTRGAGVRDPLPFGPFLAAGGVMAVALGPQAVAWYLGAVGVT